MGKELAKSQKDLLFGSKYTGIDTSGGFVYPPIINILQSDKQFKAFEDADMSTKSYGKLFVRTENNNPEDLVEEIVGTAIKIEAGHEIRDNQTIVGSGNHLLSPEEKEAVEAEGLNPVNMTKVLLAIGESGDVIAKMKEYNKKLEKGTAQSSDFPCALLPIKGSSWGSWIEAQEKMEELCQENYGVSYRDSIASLFRFSVRSEKQHSTKFGDYYSFEVGVELNDPDEAAAFAPLVVGMKDFGMFFEVAEKVGKKNEALEAEKVFEGM
jgi:hypothetical protein